MPDISNPLNSKYFIMNNSGKKFNLLLLSLILLSVIAGTVSAYDVYLGESVELGGSCTSDYVYLFLTGPNLPSNGANPEDIREEVVTGDPSTFVTVSAFRNRWTYKWDTNTASGIPDAGTYAFYAVERPFGRYDLSGAEYSVKTVKLIDPSISVTGVSSTLDNPEQPVSKETGSVTQVPTKTKEATPVPATTTPNEETPDAAGFAETPATGCPPFSIVVSIVLSLFFIMLTRSRSE